MQFRQLIPFALLLVLVACASPQTETSEAPPIAEAITESPSEAVAMEADLEEIPTPQESPKEEESIEEIEQQIEQNIQKVLRMEKPSIVDYFMALPHRLANVDCDEHRSMKKRAASITYQNLASGYLRNDLSMLGQVVVMYKSKVNAKTYIGQLASTQCADYTCGVDMQGFATLTESGEWKNVNEELLEKDSMTYAIWNKRGSGFEIHLPENGTSMKIVRCFTDTPTELGEFKWLQTHFEVELNEAGKEYFVDFR